MVLVGNTLKLCAAAVLSAVVMLAPSAGKAATYNFVDIQDTCTSCDVATALAALSLEVTSDGSTGVDFTFDNSATPNGSDPFRIDGIYFDFGSLDPVPLDNITLNNTTSPQVQFLTPATPGDLPSGNVIGFEADESADARPGAQNGVNRGEAFTIGFDLTGAYTFADITGFLDRGELRVGLQMQGFDGGGSDQFVTAPIPVPAGGLLLVSGLVGIGLLRRRRKPA